MVSQVRSSIVVEYVQVAPINPLVNFDIIYTKQKPMHVIPIGWHHLSVTLPACTDFSNYHWHENFVILTTFIELSYLEHTQYQVLTLKKKQLKMLIDVFEHFSEKTTIWFTELPNYRLALYSHFFFFSLWDNRIFLTFFTTRVLLSRPHKLPEVSEKQKKNVIIWKGNSQFSREKLGPERRIKMH